MTTEKNPHSAECPECHSENIVILAGGRTECGECGRALVERRHERRAVGVRVGRTDGRGGVGAREVASRFRETKRARPQSSWPGSCFVG